MGGDLDELFGEGGDAPTPRVATVLWLLISGLVVAVLGLACSSVPGAVLVLLAWVVIEKEMDRVENGFLPADARPVVVRLRSATRASVLVIVLVVVVQFALLMGGFYDGLLRQIIEQVAAPPAA